MWHPCGNRHGAVVTGRFWPNMASHLRRSLGGSGCGAAAWVGAAVEAPCTFSGEGVLSHHAEG